MVIEQTQAMWTFSIKKWIVRNEKTHVNHKEIVVLLSWAFTILNEISHKFDQDIVPS